jgi:drug/metabolite transporter (DMT)-like permease
VHARRVCRRGSRPPPIASDRPRRYRGGQAWRGLPIPAPGPLPLSLGILLAFLAFAVFSTTDALVKALGGSVGVFAIGFFMTAFSVIPYLLAKPRAERLSDVLRPRRPWLVHLRGLTGAAGICFSVYAFTHLPLAEAYTLIFLLPLFATIFSVMFLGESVRWRRWLAVAAGFAGVLIVLRPGFREITLAHGAGLAVALIGAANLVMIRTLAGVEKRITITFITVPYVLAITGLLMIPGFEMPAGSEWLLLAACGILGGIGHVLVAVAMTKVPASSVGPVQYSQIGWAILYGALFFDEFPDLPTLLGLFVIGASGLFTLRREQEVSPSARRAPWFFRGRL